MSFSSMRILIFVMPMALLPLASCVSVSLTSSAPERQTPLSASREPAPPPLVSPGIMFVDDDDTFFNESAAVEPVPAVPSTSFADVAGAKDKNSSAERIVLARRTILSPRPMDLKIDEDKIKKSLDLLSSSYINETALFLSPFSQDEERLMAKIKQTAPPVTARTTTASLRSVLASKALLSPFEARKAGVPVNIPVTHGPDGRLSGGYDCVTVSAGPQDGVEGSGEVVIRLKESVSMLGWAVPWSGARFMADIRQPVKGRAPEDLRRAAGEGREIEVAFDDYLHFSRYIVTGKDWRAALALQGVMFLRGLRESAPPPSFGPAELNELLKYQPREFWREFSGKLDGCYLEGKIPRSIPAEYFLSIDVPADKLDAVLAWPESAPFRHIIKGYIPN
jgi:hypothetical protein